MEYKDEIKIENVIMNVVSILVSEEILSCVSS